MKQKLKKIIELSQELDMLATSLKRKHNITYKKIAELIDMNVGTFTARRGFCNYSKPSLMPKPSITWLKETIAKLKELEKNIQQKLVLEVDLIDFISQMVGENVPNRFNVKKVGVLFDVPYLWYRTNIVRSYSTFFSKVEEFNTETVIFIVNKKKCLYDNLDLHDPVSSIPVLHGTLIGIDTILKNYFSGSKVKVYNVFNDNIAIKITFLLSYIGEDRTVEKCIKNILYFIQRPVMVLATYFNSPLNGWWSHTIVKRKDPDWLYKKGMLNDGESYYFYDFKNGVIANQTESTCYIAKHNEDEY